MEFRIATGKITAISKRPNVVVLNGETEGYGVRFNYLKNKYDIGLTVGDQVSFKVNDYECSDGTIRLKACDIALEDNGFIDQRTCE